MAKVKFYLEKRKDKRTGAVVTENVPILLFFSFNKQRLQHYTGLRIDAYKWDDENQIVKKNFSETSEINGELDKLKVKVKEIYDKAKALDIEPTVQYFKDNLNNKSKPAPSSTTFQEAVEEFIKVSKLTKGHGTIKSIGSTFNIFRTFSKTSGTHLDFSNIDQAFYNDFLEYCFMIQDYKNNYVGKLIKDLKAFLNFATDKGYNTNLSYQKKAFKKLSEEPEIIYLTYDELMHLYKMEIENKRLERIRDIFCLGCFTGMRFSDIKALSPENIHKDFILYRVVKTGETNSIPLNSYSKALLEKYKGHPTQCLPIISDVKTNSYLKELAKLAELDRRIQQNHFQGAKRISITLPLHDLITFHVSKKTFMTNFLAKGGSLHTAMAITGNKDMKTARRYFKVVDTLKIEEMTKVFG